jgi:hypothetical protein
MPLILATWEGETRRIVVRSQPGQGVCEIPSQLIAAMVGRTGDMAQVVEHLPSKCKALSLILVPLKGAGERGGGKKRSSHYGGKLKIRGLQSRLAWVKSKTQNVQSKKGCRFVALNAEKLKQIP